MKKYLYLILILSYGLALSYPRTSVGEMFTGSWCGPCNVAHDHLVANRGSWEDNAAVLRFHSSDGLEIAGSSSRESYYGTYYEMGYVPHMFIDGVDFTSNYSLWIPGMNAHAAVESYIGIEEIVNNIDSIGVRVFIEDSSYTETQQYRMMAVMTVNGLEDAGHLYNWVVRKIYTPTTGSIFNMAYGDTVEFKWAPAPEPEWNPFECDFVAYVIGPELPDVENAFKTIPHFREEYDYRMVADRTKGICNSEGIDEINMTLTNTGIETDYYHIQLIPISMPDGWDAYMLTGTTDTHIPVFPFEIHEIPLTIEGPSEGICEFIIVIDSDMLVDRSDTLFFTIANGVEILLVNDSKKSDSVWYVDYLEDLGDNFLYWNTETDGELIQFSDFEIEKIIWFCGEDTTETIQGNERTEIRNYLTSFDGKMLITGSGIGKNCRSDMTFYTITLGAQFTGGVFTGDIVESIDGYEPLSGWSADISGSNRTEIVNAFPAYGGINVLEYDDGSGAGVVKDNGSSRTVYLGFALEKVTSLEDFNDFLDKCMSFLEDGFAGIDETAKPQNISINTSPNPFNSGVKILLSGVEEHEIGITIFDLNGKQIADSSPDSRLPILGSSCVVWRPDESIGSGIYIVRLSANNRTFSKRIVYLK